LRCCSYNLLCLLFFFYSSSLILLNAHPLVDMFLHLLSS
jgi:hypothetical protein